MSGGVEPISPAEARTRRHARPAEVVLLDCREPVELEHARLEDAVHIAMGNIPERCDELDAECEIIVFCHHGIRSQHVAAYLRDRGFPRVGNMTGGIDAWSRTVDPGVPRY